MPDNHLRDSIKGVVVSRGGQLQGYADRLGIKNASLSRKMKDNSYTLSDLVELGEHTRTDLCLIDRETGNVLLNISQTAKE